MGVSIANICILGLGRLELIGDSIWIGMGAHKLISFDMRLDMPKVAYPIGGG